MKVFMRLEDDKPQGGQQQTSSAGTLRKARMPA